MGRITTPRETNEATGVTAWTVYDAYADQHVMRWTAPFMPADGMEEIVCKSTAHARKVMRAHLDRTDW